MTSQNDPAREAARQLDETVGENAVYAVDPVARRARILARSKELLARAEHTLAVPCDPEVVASAQAYIDELAKRQPPPTDFIRRSTLEAVIKGIADELSQLHQELRGRSKRSTVAALETRLAAIEHRLTRDNEGGGHP